MRSPSNTDRAITKFPLTECRCSMILDLEICENSVNRCLNLSVDDSFSNFWEDDDGFFWDDDEEDDGFSVLTTSLFILTISLFTFFIGCLLSSS